LCIEIDLRKQLAFLKTNAIMKEEEMTELKYRFTRDTLFKMTFVKNNALLKKLVARLLDIPVDSIREFEIRNPEILPEQFEGKFCRLDIRMAVNKRRMVLEIQVKKQDYYPERALYYFAREYSTSLGAGGSYDKLPQSIIISILDEDLFECKEYYSEYRPIEVTRHTLLTDRMVLGFYELRKLPDKFGNTLELWLKMFAAKTKEELLKIEELGVEELNEAIAAFNATVGSSEFQEIELTRDLMRLDEASGLHEAEKRGAENERSKWRSIVADKDAELEAQAEIIKELRNLLGE
jgi:predicted transposase/invertase (TIGR01784 family)